MKTAHPLLALIVLACPTHSGRAVFPEADLPVTPGPTAPAGVELAVPGPGDQGELPPRRAATWLDEVVCERADLDAPDCSDLALVIEDEAVEAQLDPTLILAVIEVESGWDSEAVSDRGARGLMQLRRLAFDGERSLGGIDSADPNHPHSNVRAGIRYLARLHRRFGDADLALAAYNWGPTRLAGRLRRGEEVPGMLHDYVRRVRGAAHRLRREHASAPVALAATRG